MAGFEEGLDLAESCYGESVWGVVHFESLQGYYFARGYISGPADEAVGAFFDVVEAFKVGDVSTGSPFLGWEGEDGGFIVCGGGVGCCLLLVWDVVV